MLEQVSDELGVTAVRSSALGEDSAGASFAGAHLTVLAVSGLGATIAAVQAVSESGQQMGAQSYRARLGLPLNQSMAVVVQRFIDADMAGVLFTRNPVTRADERVVEASWGLGEAVVSGLVTPDHYRVARGGQTLERTLGDKDLAIRLTSDAQAGVRTEEVPVDSDMLGVFCLGDAELAALDRLASQCDQVYGSSEHDLEFAFDGGKLFLLQRRPITGV
jgi:pyruvate,water dikinase